MARANKTYGFTIVVKELRETVPNIFRYASAYRRLNNLTSKGLWEMFVEKPAEVEEPPKSEVQHERIPQELLHNEDTSGGLLADIDPEAMEGENYNMCHFWSNFEIARLDFFRSKEYNDFFEMMDRSGGFWTERVSFLLLQIFGKSQKSKGEDLKRMLIFMNLISGATLQFTPSPQALF